MNGGTPADRPPIVSPADVTETEGAAGDHFVVAATPAIAALRPTGSGASELAETGAMVVSAPAVGGVTNVTAVGPAVVRGGRGNLTRALGTWSLGQMMSPNFLIQPAFATALTTLSGLPAESTDAPFPVVGSEARFAAAGEVQEAPVEGAPFEAPPPVGAGLITQFLPFDLGSLDQPVSRFLDGLVNETATGTDGKSAIPYSVLWVSAGLAFELTHRWHSHVNSARPVGDWKKVSRTLHGLS